MEKCVNNTSVGDVSIFASESLLVYGNEPGIEYKLENRSDDPRVQKSQ